MGILVVVAVAVGAFAWYQNRNSKTKGPTQTVVLPTAVIAAGDLSASVRIAGTVAAERFASIMAPRVQGNRNNNQRNNAGWGNDFNLLLTQLAQPGSMVKAGDLVAEFDLQAQQQRLDDYKDYMVQADNNIRRLKANLASSKEAMSQQVRSSKADWDKAVLDLKTAPVRSAIDAEKYKLAVDEAKEAYEQLAKQAKLQDESQTAQIRASEIDRDQSKIEMDRVEANLERMRIKSPINGIAVLQTLFRQGQLAQVRVGDQVNAGQPFLSIVDPSSMVINAEVNQVDAEKIRLGQKARIRLDAYPDIQLPGTVVGIGAMSKTSTVRGSYVGQIPVRLRIDEAKVDSRIIPDLTASAEVLVDAEQDALLAPRGAVFEEAGKAVVYVQDASGNWVRKEIETGLESNTQVAVRSGLRKGDVVALQRPM
jgi:multidrug resistance efflux pump